MGDYYPDFVLKNKLFNLLIAVALLFGRSSTSLGYTANRVWFEFLPSGLYRVTAQYTIPELKEMREAAIEFKKRKDAEAFYWDLLKGADFYFPDPNRREFKNPEPKPEPW